MFCNHQYTLKTGDCNLGPTLLTFKVLQLILCSCKSYLQSNYNPIFFIINIYFNINLRSTLRSTFSLSLPHYHSNTRKYVTLCQLHFPTIIQTPKKKQKFSFSKRKKILLLTSLLPSTSGHPNNS